MRLSSILPLALSLLPSILADDRWEVDPYCNRKPCPKTKHLPGVWILVGDSLTADGGGWGSRFIDTMQNKAPTPDVVVNLARPGRTSMDSWKDMWDTIHHYGDGYFVFVLIMLGYDEMQKPGASVTAFKKRIQKLGADIDWINAQPIFLTPIMLNSFIGGKLKANLEWERWAQAVRDAARDQILEAADVLKFSQDYLNKIGEADARKYFAGDSQALTGAGEIFFANMVPYSFKKNFYLDELDEWTKARDDITKAVDEGKFILP